MNAYWLVTVLYLGWFQGEITNDPRVRSALWELLADASYGFAETEEAMFVVRNDDGSLSFVRWESMQVRNHARWNAPIPRGAIAIVHTHPNATPHPSLQDMQTALRNQLPVYVVTRKRIMKTVDGVVLDVVKGDWRSTA